jgi:flagellar biosynthesis/type III secretory pathway protein FliH
VVLLKKKKPNPVIERARQEGYNNGFELGFKSGVEIGKEEACNILASKFDNLQKVPGIGPKMLEKVVNHFGREYFKSNEGENN